MGLIIWINMHFFHWLFLGITASALSDAFFFEVTSFGGKKKGVNEYSSARTGVEHFFLARSPHWRSFFSPQLVTTIGHVEQ